MLNQEDSAAEQERLSVYRRRLKYDLTRQSKLGIETPFYLVEQIREARDAIQTIKTSLRSHGIAVEDLPGDEPPTPRTVRCPYPGMAPFSEADAAHFYGRDQIIQETIQRLRLHSFLAIIGPSGSGKSSLVLAGLIPALRTSSLFGPGDWLIRILRPGEAPFDALKTALDDDLSDLPQALAKLLATQPSARRLLLVIDQFEELFTVARQDIARFQAAVARLAETPGCSVVVTARADFYPELMASPLWPQIQAYRVEIVPLNELALRTAIIQPAVDVEVQVDAALVERLVADAAEEPGVLPLIQETLVLLWERMEHGSLSLSAYTALGDPQRTGLQVAMARRADAAVAALTPEQQAIAQRIFLRLVQFGEGRADTRRRQPIAALRSSGGDPAVFDQTLRHLAHSRLLTLDGTQGDACNVDIAHEALLDGWPALHDWLETRRAAERLRRRLEDKASEWVRLGSGAGALLDAAELAEVEQWLASPDAADLGSSDDLRALVRASKAAINPGWHRWGTVGLVVASIAVVALLGLLYVVTSGLVDVVRITIWLFAALLCVLVLIGSGLLRRADPYRAQRLSHMLAQRRFAQLGVGVVAASAVALWSAFGVAATTTELYCRAEPRSFERPRGIITLAVSQGKGVDPTLVTLFSTFLSNYGSLKTWAVASADAERCKEFFTQRLELSQEPLSDGSGTQYSVRFLEPPYSAFQATGPSSFEPCQMFGDLAFHVAEQLSNGNAHPLVGGEQAAADQSCLAFSLNAEGYNDYRNGRYPAAITKLRHAIELDKNLAAAYHNLGLVYLDLADYPKAIAAFDQAVRLAPNQPDFLTNLAIACYQSGDYACAEQNDLKAIQVLPDDVDLKYYNNLAVVYREWGRFADAEAALQRATEQLPRISEPTDRRWYQTLLGENTGILKARMYRCTEPPLSLAQDQEHDRRQHCAEAIALLEQANQLDQDEHSFEEEIVYYLAVSYQSIGDRQSACRYLQHYQSVDSTRLFNENTRRQDARKRLTALGCSAAR